MSSTRQLAAIMFTDIVGYTALMGKDEKRAFELLRKNRDIQKPLIKQYHGTWIKELGDGVLASFNTVTDAVFCAAAIHQACNNVEGLQLRIGIHLGEVIFENNDVFGDGVNIASRLQAMASPGSTWVSEAVYKNLVNKKEITSEFIKEETLKNVSEPVKVYEISVKEIPGYLPDNIKVYQNQNTPGKSVRKKPILVTAIILLVGLTAVYFLFFYKKGGTTANNKTSSEKSIAVLPFLNMSNDPQQEYFSDGLSEELINMFTKLPGLKVIGRTSAFVFKGKNEDLVSIGKKLGVAYLLEGSVRKSGNTLRITAQLIKASDGTHIWSETYDREMNDIFTVQSEIARTIAQKFEIEITPEANVKIDQTPTKNIEAYDQFQKGYYFMYKKYFDTHDDEDFQKSKKFFEKAIELDPGYAEAYAGLAEVYDELRNKDWEKFPKELLVLKEQLARKALQLKPNSSFVNTAMAWAVVHRDKPDFDSSFYFLKKAFSLDPNDPLNNLNLSFTLSNDLGLHSSAIPFSLNAIKGDPLDPNNYSLLGLQYLTLGKYPEAKEAFQKCNELTNDKFNGEWRLLFGLIYFGEYDKAEKRLTTSEDWFYSFIRSYLDASKGEYSKVDTAFRNNIYVLLASNRNKILKDVSKQIETRIDKGNNTFESNYSFLSTSFYFDAYRNDPDFKRVLEKARKNQEAKMQKYGNIEMKE